MIIDVGGGTTDCCYISLGGNVVSTSIKIAGDKFDEAITVYEKKYNIMIGERTAEEMKIKIGSVYPREEATFMEVRGRNLISGLPKTVTVDSNEMITALEEITAAIMDAVHSTLEKTPPELVADISDKGIVMTGGGSLIYGLDRLINEKTGINVLIADDPISCVAIGTGRSLENIDVLQEQVTKYKKML